MMMDAVGVIANVAGSSSDMVATGPSPGSTPTSVPMNTPRKHASRLAGWSATARPYRMPPARSIQLEAPRSGRQAHAEPDLEHQVADDGRGRGLGDDGRPA